MMSSAAAAMQPHGRHLHRIAQLACLVVLTALTWLPAGAQNGWKTALVVPGAQVVSSDTVVFRDCFTLPHADTGNWYTCGDRQFRHPYRWESVQPKVRRTIDFQLGQPGYIYVLVTSRVDPSWPYNLGSAAIQQQDPGGKWSGVWLGPGLRYAHYRGERLVDTGPYASQPGIPLLKYRIHPDGHIQFWESLPHLKPGQYRLVLTSAMFHNPNTGEQTYSPCTITYKLLFVPDQPAIASGTSPHAGQPPHPAATQPAPPATQEYVWIVNDAHQVFRWNGNGWTHIPGNATDIGVGAHGTVWITGTENARFGHVIYRWMENRFVRTDGQAVRLDVGPWGTAWVVNRSGDIYRKAKGQWQRLPGGAKDIGVGPNGDVCIIGTNRIDSNYGIFQWDGSSWHQYPGAAVRVDVDATGNPWVVNSAGEIYRWNGTGWEQLPGRATDISVGPKAAWVIGTDSAPGGHGIYRWDEGIHNWTRIPGGAVAISVGAPPTRRIAAGNTLKSGTYQVVVNVNGTIFHASWHIRVENGRITGTSHWPCCPGPFDHPLQGTLNGDTITVRRDCSGGAWQQGQIQTYTGTRNGNRIEGTGTGIGLDGLPTHWELSLDSWQPN